MITNISPSGSLSGLSSGYKINWLQDVLQRYLFEDGNPTQISSAQPQYFVMIISAFENYVKEVGIYLLRLKAALIYDHTLWPTLCISRK